MRLLSCMAHGATLPRIPKWGACGNLPVGFSGNSSAHDAHTETDIASNVLHITYNSKLSVLHRPADRVTVSCGVRQGVI